MIVELVSIFSVVLSISLISVALSYLFFSFTHEANFLQYAQDEGKQLVITLLMALFVSSIDTSTTMLDHALHKASLTDMTVSSYLSQLFQAYYENIWRTTYTFFSWEPYGQYPIGLLKRPDVDLVNSFVYMLSPLPYFTKLLVYTFSFMGTTVQTMIGEYPMLLVALSIAVVLRGIRFVRLGGDALFALIISFYVVLPFSYLYLTPPTPNLPNFIIEVKIDEVDPIPLGSNPYEISWQDGEKELDPAIKPSTLFQMVYNSTIPVSFSFALTSTIAFLIFRTLRDL